MKSQLKSSLIFVEFWTIYFTAVDSLIATARSNKVATCLGFSGLFPTSKGLWAGAGGCDLQYCEQCYLGQVTGDTAKLLSERFCEIVRER